MWENEKRKIDFDFIEEIAKATGKDPFWFFIPDEPVSSASVISTIPTTPDLQQEILENTNKLLANTEKLIKRLTVSDILEKNGSSYNGPDNNNLIPFPGSPSPLVRFRTLPLMEQAIGAGEKLAEDIKSVGNITVPCQGKPDVAIRVEGLSMEPDILDGSLILVRRTQIYGSWGWNSWDIVVVWLKETDEWTVKQIQVSPDRTKVRLIGTKGYLKRYEMKDIEVQGVVEDVIKNPEEVEAILHKMKGLETKDDHDDTDSNNDEVQT